MPELRNHDRVQLTDRAGLHHVGESRTDHLCVSYVQMDYDNERDRFESGFDAGSIVDGLVTYDPASGEYVITDEDGKSFSSQELFKSLVGRKVRFTCISFEAMEDLERLVAQTRAAES